MRTPTPTQPAHVFRLYVAGDAPNSALAAENLRALCQAHLPHAHVIDVVDVTQDPRRAQGDAVLVTPTLIRLSPGPECRIVGNLSDSQAVRQALGLGLVEEEKTPLA
ncbi:MAG: circadian clock KaiB family protein [Prosthecobacter sp.]